MGDAQAMGTTQWGARRQVKHHREFVDLAFAGQDFGMPGIVETRGMKCGLIQWGGRDCF